MSNRLSMAFMPLIILATTELMGQNRNEHNRADATYYLMFYTDTRDASFAMDAIEGDLAEAKNKLKLEAKLYEMADKLYAKNAIALDEYEEKKMTYAIALENLKKQKDRQELWQSIVLTNEFQVQLSKGVNIDLRRFYEANVKRWSDECNVIDHEVKIKKLVEDYKSSNYRRVDALYKKSAATHTDLLVAQYDWETAKAKTAASLKMVQDCQKSIPTWEEVRKIENSLGHPIESGP